MSRKTSKKSGRETVQLRTGEPLSYGSTRIVPRPQERVPRSLKRTLMSARMADIPLIGRSVESPSKKRFVSVRAADRRVFRFRNPFYTQYRKLLAVGAAVRNPKRVLFCAKRKVRRQVLFAFKQAGRRGSGPGRRGTYRRTGNSLFSC